MTRTAKQSEALRKAQDMTHWRTDQSKRPGKLDPSLPVNRNGVRVKKIKTPLGKYEVDPSHTGDFVKAGIGRYL